MQQARGSKGASRSAVAFMSILFRIPLLMALLLVKSAYSYSGSATHFSALDIVTTLTSIQAVLARIGPLLSAVLFIVAGIFYALGQLFPPQKRATFQSTAFDIIIGAIIIAAISIASNGLAAASTNLLSNVTANVIS